MINLDNLNSYRLRIKEVLYLYGSFGDNTCGVFVIPALSGLQNDDLRVIASSGDGWEHVSVSCSYRCPFWAEMEYIKRKFFAEDETVMQLHVPPKDHFNCHPHTLHLWRPIGIEIPRPPAYMIGPTT